MYQLVIVDDEEDIRRGMARGIPWESWGFFVSGQAENGEEAVRLIETAKPDVVLSDIRMPKMDGIELMQYLHQNHPEIKIIILSGYNDVDYLNMAIKNRVTEYLLKPTDIDEFETLFHRIRETLDEERNRQMEWNRLNEAAMENRELFYEKVLCHMLEGYVGDSREYRWKREMEEAGHDFSHCILVVLDTPDSAENKDDNYRLKQTIIKDCGKRRLPWNQVFFLNEDKKITGIFTIPDNRDVEEERKGLEQAVKELQAEAAELYGLPLMAGISGLCTQEGDLPKLYRETAKTISSTAPDLLASQKTSSNLVTSILEFLEGEYCSNLVSLDFLAETFRKNPAYLSKLFKKETGFNFSEYITQKRMAKSKALLKDMSLKIYEVAEMTGYADASNFIKVFKKHCGISPNEFRNL